MEKYFKIVLEVYLTATVTIAVGCLAQMRGDIAELNIKMATIMQKETDFDPAAILERLRHLELMMSTKVDRK